MIDHRRVLEEGEEPVAVHGGDVQDLEGVDEQRCEEEEDEADS